MLDNHTKVTLKTMEGTDIIRFFPNPSQNDLEIGETICPHDPHFGSMLHREGYVKWGKVLIAKRTEDRCGINIINLEALLKADFT